MKRVYQELVNLIDLGIFDEQDFVRFFFLFSMLRLVKHVVEVTRIFPT